MSSVGPGKVACLGSAGLTVVMLSNAGLVVLVRSHLSGRDVAGTVVVGLLLRALEGSGLLLLAEGDAAADQASDDAEHDKDDGPDGQSTKMLLNFVGG